MFNRIASSGVSWLGLSVLILLGDRLSKDWVLAHLIPGEPLKIFPFLNFTLVHNTGAAFGFLHTAAGWQNLFLGSLAVMVSAAILIWLTRLSVRQICLGMALGLVLGGALANVWDRVLYGYVVDFLSFHLGEWYFAIFNVADSAICVGALMLMIDWLRQPKP